MTAKARDSKASDALRVHITRDLVASTVEGEREKLRSILQDATLPVVLDLKAVKEIDSLGITLLLGTFKACQKKGVSFAMEGVAPDLMRVFRLFSLPKLFPIQEG